MRFSSLANCALRTCTELVEVLALSLSKWLALSGSTELAEVLSKWLALSLSK